MFELYLFITALVVLIVIVTRRKHLFQQEQKSRFQEKISKRVQELKKVVHQESAKKFKETYKKEQKKRKTDPAEYNLLIKRAEMAISKKQWMGAKQMLIQAIALSKSDITAGLKLAWVYQEGEELNKAENLYRRLLEIRPNHAEIYTHLGEIFVEKKRYQDAIKAFARAVDLDEKNDQNLIALGKLYAMLLHNDSSIECIRRATLLKPREVYYLFLLGKAYENNNDDQSALFTYEKILTMEPYNDKAKELAQDLRIKLHSNQSVGGSR